MIVHIHRGTRHIPGALRAFALLLLLFQITACFVGARPALDGQVDLRSFYAAGTIVRSGHGSQLYDYAFQNHVQNLTVSPRAAALPFLYPAFAALPFVPLSLLSYRPAFFVLLAFNIGLLILAAALLRPWLPQLRCLSPFILPVLYGTVFGVSMALMQGQISFLLLVIFCGTFVLLRRKAHFLAGLLMSLALIKFQIALPIALLYLIWRQWRFLSGFVTGALVLAAASLGITGTSGALVYFRSMAGITTQTALHAADAKTRFGMFPTDMPNLHGLAFGLSRGSHWGLLLTIALSAAVLIFAARQKRSLLVALPAAMLVSYHMQPHDLTLLLLPLSMEIDRVLRPRSLSLRHFIATEWLLVATLLLLVVPLAAVLKIAGLNFLVSFSVCGTMVLASRRSLAKVEAISPTFQVAA